MTWKITRPGTPALPNSFFWTWDHSTNWVLDDPGALNFGCGNQYMKRPETFIEDYRQLTDFAAMLGVKGIIIWGFLRDSHGGVDSARRVAEYAASRNIAIMPGIGTTWYGGVYYEGDHPYNIETFVRKNPSARFIDEKGVPQARGTCPTHPLFREWLQEGLEWLFREIPVGGVNLENGDFLVCHDPGCEAHRATWPAGDPEFFRLQAISYMAATEALRGQLSDKLITWATYCGFLPVKPGTGGNGYDMNCERPVIVDRVEPQSIAQWTLTQMVRPEPLPLTAYLDDGAPAAAFDNPRWPDGLRPPSQRGVGFIHQGSQWTVSQRYNQQAWFKASDQFSGLPATVDGTQWIGSSRYDLVLSTIKEGCLRAWRSGLEGVGIHGEVTPRYIPWALNYLAFSHFIHWPEDSLREFGRKTLGQVFEDEKEGEDYAELLAYCDSAALIPEMLERIQRREMTLRLNVMNGQNLDKWRFWFWLARMARSDRDMNGANCF